MSNDTFWPNDLRGSLSPRETSSLLGSDDSAHTAYSSTDTPDHPCRAASKGCCCVQHEAVPSRWSLVAIGKRLKGALVAAPSHINATIEKRQLGFWSFTLAVFLIGWVFSAFFSSDSMNSAVRDRIRDQWQKENEHHQVQVDRMQSLIVKWADEIKAHNAARAAMQTERSEWAIERKKWEKEHEEREKVLLGERQLELERKKREAEKEIEEEKKAKAGVKFVEPQPEPQCLRYGARKWTAKLDNVPAGFDPILVCRDTKALIHGRWLVPETCENKGTWSGTIGTWYIDFEEAACRTTWNRFQDKGCTAEGSGKRRIEAKLDNVRPGDNWEALCASTPAEFHGLKFDGPDSCADWGRMGYGGVWFIEDGNC